MDGVTASFNFFEHFLVNIKAIYLAFCFFIATFATDFIS